MILVGILYTKGLDDCASLLSTLSESERRRIEKIKNQERKELSTLSRLFIKKLFEEYFSKKMPEISYGEYGKPFFKDEKTAFSVSYDKGAVAVLISDEERVGLDIQSFEGDEKNRDGIEKRFFSGLVFSPENESFDFEIRFFEAEINDGALGLVEKDENLTALLANGEKANFLWRWTRLEACLKLFGGGFKDYKNANESLQKAKIKTVFFKHGSEDIALSVALAR